MGTSKEEDEGKIKKSPMTDKITYNQMKRKIMRSFLEDIC